VLPLIRARALAWRGWALVPAIAIAGVGIALLGGLLVRLDAILTAPTGAVVTPMPGHPLDERIIALLHQAPEVGRVDATPAVSAEILLDLPMQDMDARIGALTVRGVDPPAIALRHGAITLVRGVLPAVDQPGIIVSEGLLGRYPGISYPGGSAWMNGERWPIVGVFRATAGLAQSELWVDRRALARAFHLPYLTEIFVDLVAGASAEGLSARIERESGGAARAIAPATYERWLRGEAYPHLWAGTAIMLGLALLLGLLATPAVAAPPIRRAAWGALVALVVALLAAPLAARFPWEVRRTGLFVPQAFSLRLLIGAVVFGALQATVGSALGARVGSARRQRAILHGLAVVGLSTVVMVVCAALVRTVVGGWRSLAANNGAIVMPQRMFDGLLPRALADDVQRLAPGHRVHWFRNFRGDLPSRFLLVMAISDDYLEIFGPDGTLPPPDDYRRWREDRSGIILVGRTPQQTGWRRGDRAEFQIGGRTISGTVRGIAGGKHGGFAPDKVIVHYDDVDQGLADPLERGKVVMINVDCRAVEERALADRLRADLADRPVLVLYHDGVVEYDLMGSDLLGVLRVAAPLLGLLLVMALWSVRLPLLGWLIAGGAAAFGCWWRWRHDGIPFGAWILENLTVTPGMAALGAALVLLAGCALWVVRARFTKPS
jgi:hypothetical protein